MNKFDQTFEEVFSGSDVKPELVNTIDLNDPKDQDDQERKYNEFIKKHYNVK